MIHTDPRAALADLLRGKPMTLLGGVAATHRKPTTPTSTEASTATSSSEAALYNRAWPNRQKIQPSASGRYPRR